MQCPLCKSRDIKERFRQPIVYGGRNAIEGYSCNVCGVMFVETKNNKISIPSLHTKEEMDERLKKQFDRA